MSTSTASRSARQLIRQALRQAQCHSIHRHPLFPPIRSFTTTPSLAVVRPYLLADIGEGITECQIIQWFVQPGARVAQFDKICEVQSDKAAVEITSRFDGVVKKLYYEADDVARVGKPLVDIDIEGELDGEAKELVGGIEKGEADESREGVQDVQGKAPARDAANEPVETAESQSKTHPEPKASGKHATLATPAVRHLTKEHGIDIADISGTGKDGRVLKEDVQAYASARDSTAPPTSSTMSEALPSDKTIAIAGIQKAMYNSMTASLKIPHFLYSDTIDITSLSRIRHSLNKANNDPTAAAPKLSALPFIIKAVSLSLLHHPQLNAHLHTSDPTTPRLTQKAAHNIAFAVDTPQGLMVPVLHNVQSHTILSLAAEITRLAALARGNKLASADLAGATFTVSNIGAIGGLTVAPVIMAPQVAIVGIGRAKAVPAFDGEGKVVRREEVVFSWGADHRVLDGAVVARCADRVRGYLEDVEGMLVRLR